MNSYETVSLEEAKRFVDSFAAFLRKTVRFVFRAVQQHFLLAGAITLLGSAAAFFYWHSQTSLYQSVMVCSYNTLHKKTFGELVHRLDHLAATGSYGQLARVLGISPEQAGAIRGFDARNAFGSPLQDDVTEVRSPMYFTLSATNPQIFEPVQQGLLQYLNNVEYQQKRLLLDRERMKNRIAYLDASIVRIDSVIAAYTAALKSGRMTADTVSGPAGITTLFRHQEELSDRKLEEIKALNLLQPVDLIYGFIPAEKPAGRDLKKLMWAVIASMALGVFVAVARRIAVYE